MVTIDFAREHRYMIDFVANPPQLRPNKLGVTVINDYPMREVRHELIRWGSWLRLQLTHAAALIGGEVH